MADREINVSMESRYKSDLAARLRADKRKIEAFQAHLNRRPLNIPVKLDLRGAMTQAAALRKAILGEFARMPASILGADGRPATAATSGKSMNKKAGVLSTTEFQKFDDKEGKWITDRIEQVEQLGRGITQLSKFKDAASEPFATVTKDVSNVQELADSLRTVNTELQKVQARARGRGDRGMQIDSLKAQAKNIEGVLAAAVGKGLENSPVYQKAENKLSAIQQRIQSLEGGEESAAMRQARKDRTRDVANQITAEERRVQEALKANKLEMDASERIADKGKREAEVNRLYDERRKLFEGSRDKFRAMDADMQSEGRADLSDRAMRRTLGMQNQANQAELDKARAETDRMRENAKEQERIDKENQRRAEKAKRLADQAAARSGKRNFARAMRMDEYSTKLELSRSAADEARAKAIPDRTAREAELNRVLAERARIYQDQSDRMRVLEGAQRAAGNDDNAAKAEAAKLKASESASKVAVDQTRADSAAQIAAQKESDAAKRKADADARAAREIAFEQEMKELKSASNRRIAQINAEERKERAAAASADERRAASAKAHSARVSEYNNLSTSLSGVESRARAAGHDSAAARARGRSLNAGDAAARDMEKFAVAANRSGHSLNFHTGALLRNAMTFARWMIPVQAVLGLTSAFSAGFEGAMKVDRQFATLRSVFRGTDEEVAKLRNDTLALAASQGRSADEAMDAAIRWSRLGLNRVQVNEAVRTSLMAANVAEIKASEAAEKLSAIYATYRLNVGDLPVVLSRLNAISNRYNVTNKDLLEGIVRVAGVAKEAGMSLRDLEGIIGAVTGATGRPGQEVGNALKFVITRLASPETMEGLQKAFDINLTGPNGDLKEMGQIFSELADIYPTLNNAQKQYFLKLTAGSRQAARFALILDQYRQSQILAAEAGFDTASAFQENQKILESLDSRLEALKATWTSLFTAMGDSGVFDFIEKRLRGIQDLIDGISSKPGQKGKDMIAINDPTLSETVENLGGGWDSVWGTAAEQSQESLMRTILQINKAIQERKKLIAENADTVGNIPMSERMMLGNGFAMAGANSKISSQGITAVNPNTGMKFEMFANMKEAQDTINALQALLEGGGDTGATDAISQMTSEVNALRERMGSLERASNVFDSLNKSIENGSADRQTMVRDFENAAHLLLNLEDGATLYGDAVQRFYKMLESGDNAGIQKLLEELSGLFKGDMANSKANFDKALDPALKALRAKLAEIEKQRRDLISGPQGENAEERRDRQNALEKIQGDAKAAQSAIEQLTQAQEKFNKSAYGPVQDANISKFLTDLTEQASKFDEAFKDFAPDSERDPVGRIFQRRRNTAMMGRRWMEDIQRRTNIQSLATKKEAVNKQAEIVAGIQTGAIPIDQGRTQIEQQQRIIDQMDEANLKIETQIRLEDDKLKGIMRELEIQEQIASLQRVSTDASKRAEVSSLAWRFGETESDKDANQASAAIERARRGLGQAGGEWMLGKGDPASRAKWQGQILQDEATARTALEAMERRQYELEAARRQIAFDTAKAMRQQTEEAGRRLALASREDQLRAAALARTLRDTGPVKDREFFALSQESRQAFVNYLPNQAPDFLNEAKVEAAKANREINEEKGRLTRTIGNLRGALDSLSKSITENLGRGKPLDVDPGAPGKSIQDAANTTRDKSPMVNVNIGNIAVSMQFSEQVERIVTGYVDRKINQDLAALERRLSRPAVPNAQGVVE